jgi:hypothetical protein
MSLLKDADPPVNHARRDLAKTFWYSRKKERGLRGVLPATRRTRETREGSQSIDVFPAALQPPPLQASKTQAEHKNDRDIKSIRPPRFVENRTPVMLIHPYAIKKSET